MLGEQVAAAAPAPLAVALVRLVVSADLLAAGSPLAVICTAPQKQLPL